MTTEVPFVFRDDDGREWRSDARVRDSRDPECVAKWADCEEGGYDPACCRWPKSCSCIPPNHDARWLNQALIGAQKTERARVVAFLKELEKAQDIPMHHQADIMQFRCEVLMDWDE